MIRDLIKVANKLDYLGLTKEADAIDALIRTASGMGDPKKERKKAILEELDRLDPKRQVPRSTLSYEERARITYAEEHVMMVNDFVAREDEVSDPRGVSDEYGLTLESAWDIYNNAINTFDYVMYNEPEGKFRKFTDGFIQDEKNKDKERHKAIIEGSKPRYPNVVRTEENSPSWFKDKMRGRDIQMGGMSLDDEGDWSYGDSSSGEPSYIPSYIEGEEEEED